MSGGRFEYRDMTLKDSIFGWDDKVKDVFEDREISELIWDVFDLIHSFDWYKSSDTDEEQYLEDKARFKKKWLNNKGVRVRRIIDETLNEAKQELYKTYGIKIEEDES